jgi:hypothetical protein
MDVLSPIVGILSPIMDIIVDAPSSRAADCSACGLSPQELNRMRAADRVLHSSRAARAAPRPICPARICEAASSSRPCNVQMPGCSHGSRRTGLCPPTVQQAPAQQARRLAPASVTECSHSSPPNAHRCSRACHPSRAPDRSTCPGGPPALCFPWASLAAAWKASPAARAVGGSFIGATGAGEVPPLLPQPLPPLPPTLPLLRALHGKCSGNQHGMAARPAIRVKCISSKDLCSASAKQA